MFYLLAAVRQWVKPIYTIHLLILAVFAGYCIRFRFNAQVLPEFVYGFTKTDAYASWVAAIQRPAGQPNINKEEFKSLGNSPSRHPMCSADSLRNSRPAGPSVTALWRRQSVCSLRLTS